MEAIVAATRYGGELMGRGDDLGQIRPGFLADLLIVDGDPLADLSVLQQQDSLRLIIKDGQIYKNRFKQTDRADSARRSEWLSTGRW